MGSVSRQHIISHPAGSSRDPDGQVVSDPKRMPASLLSTNLLRILTFTTLFPNAEMPRHGSFVAERLRHLLASGKVAATVMAPVPWFPLTGKRFGEYGRFARVPLEEDFGSVSVCHPRYLVLPKID